MPSLIWNMATEEDVFLTFDDGPTPNVTEWVLDTLSKYNAKATFFCLGRNVERYPDLYHRILAEGHKIGNHTYSHQKGWSMSVGGYIEDVDFANQYINSNIFRPPYGLITPSQARMLSKRYHIIMWDILSQDYSNLISPRACLHNVIKHVRPGSIIVFHDSLKSFKNLEYALPRTLSHIDKMGLKCVMLEP